MSLHLFSGGEGNEQGSLTIEALLVFTAVFFSFTLLLMSFLLLYNKFLLQQTAAEAAREAALLRRMEGRSWEGDDKGVLSPTSQAILESFIRQKLEGGVIKPKNTAIEVYMDRMLLGSTLKVNLVQEYSIPFGCLKAIIDGEEYLCLGGTGETVLLEPAQFIRGVDLGWEYFQRLRKKVAEF